MLFVEVFNRINVDVPHLYSRTIEVDREHKRKIVCIIISPIQVFFFCFFSEKYVTYEKKRYSLIIQGRKLQVKLAQLVLRSMFLP